MIIHLDLDCFFVSAERTRIPALRHKPVVVCKGGDTKIFSTDDHFGIMTNATGAFSGLFHHQETFCEFVKDNWKKEFMDEKGNIHGIVIAKSYEAKKFGIKTGTSLRDARIMCPDLLIIKSDHLFYQQLSTALKDYLHTKIPLLEQYSIDEFWGDLKGWVKDNETYAFMASLQKEILERFDLPISIGASSSKWTAKLATDFNKPYGLTLIEKENIVQFVTPMLINTFPGIGKAMQKKLKSYGIETLGEVLQSHRMIQGWGKIGKSLISRINGTDNELVIHQRDRKSLGISRNFLPTSNREEIKRRTIILARHLSHTITKLSLHPTTYSLKLGYINNISTQSSHTIERTFSETMYKNIILQTLIKIDTYPHLDIHHITLNLSNFITPAQHKTFSLFNVEEDEKAKRLSEKLTKLRDKYGIDIVRSGLEKQKNTP